jgi:hypothetical protein
VCYEPTQLLLNDPPEQAKAEIQKAMDTYGKVIITWKPNDLLPAFPPQEQQVEHPFMVNSTVKPETMKGSFNQFY